MGSFSRKTPRAKYPNSPFFFFVIFRYSVGFDIDPDAIAIAQENSDEFETDIDFVLTDLSLETDVLARYKGCLDTIVMNPPFGTKNKGVDMVLLKKAIEVSLKIITIQQKWRGTLLWNGIGGKGQGKHSNLASRTSRN